jgi:DNA repair exonuclease SbcCD ATPase subunit
MSQIETVMLIGLGFAVAALLALFVGRFAWDIALSIGRRKAGDHAPAALIELQTERDRLRAEHAMLSRKLELKLEDYKNRVVEQMAEVSRNRNRIQNFASEIATRDAVVAERDKEIAKFKERIAALEADAASREQQAKTAGEQIKAQDVETFRLKGEIEALTLKLAERDRSIELLQAELSGRPEPAPPDSQAHLRQRIAELKDLSRQIAEQREQLKASDASAELADSPAAQAVAEQGKVLESKIADAERDVDELAAELEQLDKKWQNRLNGAGKREKIAAGGEGSRGGLERPFPSLGGVANVISLAQRIRSLKKDITG